MQEAPCFTLRSEVCSSWTGSFYLVLVSLYVHKPNRAHMGCFTLADSGLGLLGVAAHFVGTELRFAEGGGGDNCNHHDHHCYDQERSVLLQSLDR